MTNLTLLHLSVINIIRANLGFQKFGGNIFVKLQLHTNDFKIIHTHQLRRDKPRLGNSFDARLCANWRFDIESKATCDFKQTYVRACSPSQSLACLTHVPI